MTVKQLVEKLLTYPLHKDVYLSWPGGLADTDAIIEDDFQERDHSLVIGYHNSDNGQEEEKEALQEKYTIAEGSGDDLRFQSS